MKTSRKELLESTNMVSRLRSSPCPYSLFTTKSGVTVSIDSLTLLTPASEDTHLLLTDVNIDTHSCRIIEQKKIRERL